MERSQGEQTMSDTPRTDRNFIGMQIVPAVFAQQLERELNAANERIRQLKAKCFESTQDGKALAEMLRIVEEKTTTDHIPDAAKMIHDTPRTYRAYRQSLYSLFRESRLLEKEVNSYKIHIEMQEKRIKKLMAENDALRADLLLWNEKEPAP